MTVGYGDRMAKTKRAGLKLEIRIELPIDGVAGPPSPEKKKREAVEPTPIGGEDLPVYPAARRGGMLQPVRRVAYTGD